MDLFDYLTLPMSYRALFLVRLDLPLAKPSLVPDWVTPADQHIFGVPGKCPVPWERSKENLATNGECVFTVIKQKRYEECSVAPGPNNDVIVGSVLVLWTDTMITALKLATSGDWPQAHAAWNLQRLLKAAPFD
jgi:hypothetical protein